MVTITSAGGSASRYPAGAQVTLTYTRADNTTFERTATTDAQGTWTDTVDTGSFENDPQGGGNVIHGAEENRIPQARIQCHRPPLSIGGIPRGEFLENLAGRAERHAVRPAQCTFVPDQPGQATSDHGFDLTAALNWYRANLHPRRELAPPRALPSVYVIQGYTGQLDMWQNRVPFEPTFLERLDHSYRTHKAWTGADFGDKLASEVFMQHTGIAMQHVQYKGGSQATNDLLGAEVLPQHAFDGREVLGGIALVPPGAAAAAVRLLHREHRAVVALGVAVEHRLLFRPAEAGLGDDTLDEIPAGTSFTWKGPYNAATTYAADDVVSYSGSAYIAIAAFLIAFGAFAFQAVQLPGRALALSHLACAHWVVGVEAVRVAWAGVDVEGLGGGLGVEVAAVAVNDRGGRSFDESGEADSGQE